MKKIFSLIFVACFIFLLCSCNGNDIIKPKENPATDFEYSVNEEYSVIQKYIGTDKAVVIPEIIEGKPVKVINTCSFMSQSVEKVTLPSTVTIIWNKAFANCTSLKEVTFGDSITEIMEDAFFNCSSLAEIKLPENLEKLGYRSFRDCTSLKKVFITKNLKQMGMEAFYNCPIEQLTLEDGIKKFGSYAAFWGSTFKELEVPASVEEIGEYSFHENLEKVTFLGDAPQKTGDQPFAKETVIYYKKGTVGWDSSSLKDEYKLIAK